MFFRRTPEKILKEQFNIEFYDFDYSIESFNEQWDDNGDGFCQILFKINRINPANLEYLINTNLVQLPILEKIPPNELPWNYLAAKKGYYLYEASQEDPRNFKLFIFDTENKVASLYYQIE